VSATVDVNVLVYASAPEDPAHEAARAIVEQLALGPELVYVFWPTLLGYLRIVTHPGILVRPLSSRDAQRNVEALIDRPHVRTAGEIDGFWPLFRSAAGPGARGNDIPDAHLVALMRQHGVRLIYTRDRAFRRFDGVEVRDPIG
jgi:toxin-antitoxin system PIN domain toxin